MNGKKPRQWYRGQNLKKLKFVSSQENRLTLLIHITPIVATLQNSTVSHKTEFSRMNFRKNNFRSVLHNDSLNDLLMTKLFQPQCVNKRQYLSSKMVHHIQGHKHHLSEECKETVVCKKLTSW
jgi:hypothetical protein